MSFFGRLGSDQASSLSGTRRDFDGGCTGFLVFANPLIGSAFVRGIQREVSYPSQRDEFRGADVRWFDATVELDCFPILSEFRIGGFLYKYDLPFSVSVPASVLPPGLDQQCSIFAPVRLPNSVSSALDM